MNKNIFFKKIFILLFFTFVFQNVKSTFEYKNICENTYLFPAIKTEIKHSKERTAIHEAAHLIVAEYFLGTSKLETITIKESTECSGQTVFKIHPTNKHAINIMLASYIIEELFFGAASTGTHGDLNIIIEDIIKFYPQATAHNITEIKNILQNYINETKNIILQNIDSIKIFTNILLTEKDTLNNTEITAIFNQIKNNSLTIAMQQSMPGIRPNFA